MLERYNKKHKVYLNVVKKFIKNYSITDSMFKLRILNIEYFVSRNKKRNCMDCIIYENGIPIFGFYTGKKVTNNWYYGTLNQYYEYFLTRNTTKQNSIKNFFDIKLYYFENDTLLKWCNEKSKSLYAHVKTNASLQKELVELYFHNKHLTDRFYNYDITVSSDRYIFYVEHFRKIIGIKILKNGKILASKSSCFVFNNDIRTTKDKTIHEIYAALTNKLSLPRIFHNNDQIKGNLYEFKIV